MLNNGKFTLWRFDYHFVRKGRVVRFKNTVLRNFLRHCFFAAVLACFGSLVMILRAKVASQVSKAQFYTSFWRSTFLSCKRWRCRYTFGRSTRTISADGCSMSTHAWASDTHEIARVSAEGCSADAVGKQNSHFATRPTRDQPAVGESSAQEFNSLMVVHSCLWCTARHWEGSSLKAFYFGKRIETRNVGSAPHVAHGFSMGLGKARGNVFSKWTICFDLHRMVHVW